MRGATLDRQVDAGLGVGYGAVPAIPAIGPDKAAACGGWLRLAAWIGSLAWCAGFWAAAAFGIAAVL